MRVRKILHDQKWTPWSYIGDIVTYSEESISRNNCPFYIILSLHKCTFIGWSPASIYWVNGLLSSSLIDSKRTCWCVRISTKLRENLLLSNLICMWTLTHMEIRRHLLCNNFWFLFGEIVGYRRLYTASKFLLWFWVSKHSILWTYTLLT